MKIALVGGIYGKDEEFRKKLQVTPETLLEKGLRDRGHEVATYGHYTRINSKHFEIVHVHHLGYGAARMAVDGTSAVFAYTSHDPLAMVGQLYGLRRRASRFVMSRADAVVALSAAEADFQKRQYSLVGALHRVIPNGIDDAIYRFDRNNGGTPKSTWQLLYVGQLTPLKNVHVLLHALTQVKEHIELNLVYHNSALEGALHTLASALGLHGRVHFLGHKSPKELAALYHASDIFVLPSAGEALPSVITEAMLCGTPVVATDVGGVREQLGGYGVCVVPGDSAELASAISHVLDHYDQFSARSGSASAYARERFSISRMVDSHLELYASLLERKGPRRRHSVGRVAIDTVLRTGVSIICATK